MGRPHRTKGRDVKPNLCWEPDRCRRTSSIDSTWWSRRLETLRSSNVRSKIVPADYNSPLVRCEPAEARAVEVNIHLG